MSRQRRAGSVLAWVLAAVLLPAWQARAAGLYGDVSVLGQVREGDRSRETEAPQDLYGDVRLTGLPLRSRIDTFFRLEEDFARGYGQSDFYAGSLEVPGAIPGVTFTVGRQFLDEVPGGVFVADAGKIAVDLGGPISLTVFGGAPQYFESTSSADQPSQDETIWGARVSTTRLKNGSVGFGFLQQEREQRIVRQLLSATFTKSLPHLYTRPSFYGTVAYDADRGSFDLGTAGVNLFLARPRLLLNIEGSYYKPQDQGNGRVQSDVDRREDAIFELFSVSELAQLRGGLRYVLSPSMSVFGDYSYQRYDKLSSREENGHVGSAGLLWLPGGDGLEFVRLEYYLVDSDGGNVNGGRLYYESRVYEKITFRTKLDVTYYEKSTNEEDTAVAGFLGLGYELLPRLGCEVNFEANHNSRFDEDFRVGFLLTYNLRQPFGTPWSSKEAS